MKYIISTLKQPSFQKIILWITIAWFLLFQIILSWKEYARPFREQYLYTLYYHSQWVMPEAIQSIGDDGLYQVAGHQLIQKHNFFEINPEVPPLGKYYYGTSIYLLGNAEKGALFLFLIGIVLYYLLVRKIIRNPLLQGFAILFFVTDPLLFYQSYVSMLDLPQLVALLGHTLAVLVLISAKKSTNRFWSSIVLAGLTLGLFMSLKIGFLGVIIIGADLLILWKKKQLMTLFPMLFLMGLTYIAAYSMYFVQGHSIVEFLQAQKWMLNFYLSSQVEPVFGTVFSTILLGRIIGWNQDSSWTQVAEWTIAWSLFFIGTLIFSGRSVTTKKLPDAPLLYLLLLTFGLLAGYTILPFFTRYLVLIVPFFILFTMALLEKLSINKNYVLSGLLILFVIHYYMFWN